MSEKRNKTALPLCAPTALTLGQPVCITDSSLPDSHFVRESAILLYARDTMLGHDSAWAENALRWARHIFDTHEGDAHDGDCTKQAHTCIRCLIDEAKREAREIHDD